MAFPESTDEFQPVKFYHLQTGQTKSVKKGRGDGKRCGWSAGVLQAPDSLSCCYLEAAAAAAPGSAVPTAAQGAESAELRAQPF